MSDQQEALSWENAAEQATELGIGGDGNFLTIEDGENVVRILSEPIHYLVYFLGKGIKPVYAENADDEMKTKNQVTHRFACYVYNPKVKKVQLAELGWSIVKVISKFAKSSQNSFKGCPPYDIIINRSGSGKQTEYAVMPGRNEDKMSEVVLAEFAEKQDIKEYLKEQVANQAGVAPVDDENATEGEKEEAAAKAAAEVGVGAPAKEEENSAAIAAKPEEAEAEKKTA